MSGTNAPSRWNAADTLVIGIIAARHTELDRPILVGLAGAQGSGKSTMAARLAARLDGAGLGTVTLALDDFYLTRAERAGLAGAVHPLLATRGVPGTHDVRLLAEAIDALLAGGTADLPRFDKATDDRAGWSRVGGRCDVVLCEGWCLGARPQSAAELLDPVNALERVEDADGRWRSWVNDRLAGDYAGLFARLDLKVMLRAPGFAVVEGWRSEQEAGLEGPGMRRSELARFVAHYERITRAMFADPPADLVIELDASRTPRL